MVCFRTNAGAISRLVELLQPQVDHVILSDNSPDAASGLARLASASLTYLPMDANLGTAGALNHAWRHALAQGATHVVSFDQDSEPAGDLVAALMSAMVAGLPGRRPLAAVGPVWHDARTGQPLRILRPVGFTRRHAPPPRAGLVEVDHLISSGCLMPARVHEDIGPFDESLFLDYVDIEWSLRARSRGYALAVCAAASMKHAIGDDVRRIAGRQLAIHRPERSYLLARNHLLLWRRPNVRLPWLLWDMLLVVGKLVGSLILAPSRRERATWILRGVVDGLKQRTGAPPDKH